MSKLLIALATTAFAIGVVPQAYAASLAGLPQAKSLTVVQAQEDCEEGQVWNPETEKCEKPEQ